MKAVLKNLLTRVEWNEQGIATRFFPTSCSTSEEPIEDPRSVAIDPRVSFGRPVVVDCQVRLYRNQTKLQKFLKDDVYSYAETKKSPMTLDQAVPDNS